MSKEQFGITKKTSQEPLERAIVQRRSELYAGWIAAHPLLWGWVLFATFNTIADLVVHFLFWEDSFNGLTHFHLLLWGAAVLIWCASVAWAKRLNWKQWIAFAVALMVTLAGVLGGVVIVGLAHFDMSSGPPARTKHDFFDVLLPLLGALPGLCLVVVAVLRRKKRN